MKHALKTCFLWFLFAGWDSSCKAQDTTAYPAIRETINRLFTGMRSGDSAVVRSVFAPDAVLFTTFVDSKKNPLVESGSLQEFLVAVGTPHESVWDERIHHIEIRADDGLGQVWAPYTFYLDDQRSHCGVNAFQLVATKAGWKIQALTDSRRREPCE